MNFLIYYLRSNVLNYYFNKFLFTDDGTPTQLVALQSEDGTQQLAVPVIDPHTGQVNHEL